MNYLHGLPGYAKWAAAKITNGARVGRELGDIARTCAQCQAMEARTAPALVRAAVWLMGVQGARLGFCGSEEKLGDGVPLEERTCGCLVLAEAPEAAAEVRINGVPLKAAGKPEVKTEKCPRGKW